MTKSINYHCMLISISLQHSALGTHFIFSFLFYFQAVLCRRTDGYFRHPSALKCFLSCLSCEITHDLIMQHLALKLNHMQNERGEITKLSKFNFLHKKKVFFFIEFGAKVKKKWN